MSQQNVRKFAVAKRKRPITTMDVDDDPVVPAPPNLMQAVPGVQATAQIVQPPPAFQQTGSTSSLQSGFQFGQFPTTPSQIPSFAFGQMQGASTATATQPQRPFLSQSEGQVNKRARTMGSQFLLQPVGTARKYVSLPDENGIMHDYPVNDFQMHQFHMIINTNQTNQPSPALSGQHPSSTFQSSFGSLPSTTSTQSVVSNISSQASGLNVRASSTDLPGFLTAMLQNPRSPEEILQCKQMLEQTYLQMLQEGDRK